MKEDRNCCCRAMNYLCNLYYQCSTGGFESLGCAVGSKLVPEVAEVMERFGFEMGFLLLGEMSFDSLDGA